MTSRTFCLAIAVTCFASDASAQHLYIRAIDTLGAAVTDLTADEITVREDGVPRELVDVRLANLPMKLTVLVDNGTVMNNRISHFRDGLTELMERLRPNQVVSILTFASQPRWVVRPTTDREEIQESIDILTPDPAPLRFFDALIEAAERIEEDDEPHRPVIVVVTADALDVSTVNQDRYNELVARLRRNRSTVHAVLIRSRAADADFIPQACINLTDLTGGYYAAIATTTGIGDRLAEVADVIATRTRELSRQFVVRYRRPDDAPEPQQVAVELDRGGLRFDITPDGRLPEGPR